MKIELVFRPLLASLALTAFLCQTVEASSESQEKRKMHERLNPVAAARKATERLGALKNQVSGAEPSHSENDNSKSTQTSSPPKDKREKIRIEDLRDKWALVVGVEKFLDAKVTGVKAAENSALIVSELFSNPTIGKFGPGRIVAVTGGKATSANLAKVLGEQWLLKNALPNDLVVIYFATRTKPSAAGDDLLLYTFDTKSDKPEENAIKLKEVLSSLKTRSQSRRILCLLDLSPDGSTDNKDLDLLAEIADSTDCAILSAAGIGEKSQYSPASGTSLFVAALAEAMSVGQGSIDFQAIAEHIDRSVKEQAQAQWQKEQSPVLAIPRNNDAILKTALGCEVKSSTPPKSFKIGHPTAHPSESAGAATITPRRTSTSSRTIPRRVITSSSSSDSTRGARSDKPARPRSNVDFSVYMDKMKKDIQAKWKTPKGFNAQRIVAVFSIYEDGQIMNAEIVESSGSQEIDKSALEALKLASPLDPLPEGSPPYVQIRYQFDWKVNKN